MKIGYIVQQFYPTAYGSGVHAFELVGELAKLGHEIHVITKGEPSQKREEVFKGIHVHRMLNFLQVPYYFPFNSVLLWKYGKRIIQKLNLDILLGHGFESSFFFKMNKQLPFVYKAAGTIELQRARDFVTWYDVFGRVYFPFLGRLEKFALTRADFVIAISNAIKQELIDTYEVPKEKIIKILNGVNANRFHPSHNYAALKDKLGLNSRNIILFAGRMSPIKGPHILLQAIPSVVEKFPECTFIFLGDGPLLTHLRYMARKLRVNTHVKFLGFTSNAAVPKYFAMADLCVIPSLYEPFGLVALESLASGTPILSSSRGGLAEIHDSLKNFPTISPLTPKNLVKQLISLLSQSNKLKILAKLGRKMVLNNFTWSRSASQTDKVLRLAIRKRKKN